MLRQVLSTLVLALAVSLVVASTDAEERHDRGEDHWSFKAPVRRDLPSCDVPVLLRGGLDTFIVSRLEREGLKPSPEADPATLLRRLTLDLTGLPPSPEEIRAFLSDDSPDAYERVVDRLLASPHFGERWGRYWLDLARYADTAGYTLDSPRPWAWRWRDWVIDAINSDLPYDDFSIAQLAGDLLPEATVEDRVATGFHRNTLRNFEGGVDQEEYRVRAVVDRVNTTTAVWRGLTVGCAQCHDHKYDPVSQKEFFRFFAFFNNDDEPDIAAPLPRQVWRYEEQLAAFDQKAHEAEKQRLESALADARSRLPAKVAEWEAGVDVPETPWTVLVPKTYGATSTPTKMKLLDDASILVGGGGVFFNNFSMHYETDLEGITAFRVETLPDPSLPGGGPGRHETGNFFVSEFRVAVATPEDAARDADPTQVGIRRAIADVEQDDRPIALSLDGDTDTGWSIGPSFGRHHAAIYFPEAPVGKEGGSVLTVGIDHHYHTIGRFRLLATNAPLEALKDAERIPESEALPYPVIRILRTKSDARTPEERAVLEKLVETIDPEIRELRAKIAALPSRVPQPPATHAPTLAMRDKDLRKTFVHVRGDFLRKGDEVAAGTPAVLPAFSGRGEAADRLDLARWIVNDQNPLSRRVFANRLWQRLFSKGIVLTTDDFGSQGERPSHPELLDWLAHEVTRLGWSRKALIRSIVTSRTYRQSSFFRQELAERDPDNRLLARQNRYRLEAEILRDLGLTVGGQMTWRIGGRSVHPPLPGEVEDLGFANLVPWQVSDGDQKYRRGVYIFVQRTVPYPMLTTFDAPESTVTCVEREISNTPLHALFLLNDRVFVEYARALGRRIMDEAPPTVAGRSQYAYLLTHGRRASPDRQDGLRGFHGRSMREFSIRPELAREFTGYEGDARELAAWTAVARVLMNTDRYLTRE